MTNNQKFKFMLRKKEIFTKVEFYFDPKVGSWMVELENGVKQIVGNSSLDVAYNIGNGFFDFLKKNQD